MFRQLNFPISFSTIFVIKQYKVNSVEKSYWAIAFSEEATTIIPKALLTTYELKTL